MYSFIAYINELAITHPRTNIPPHILNLEILSELSQIKVDEREELLNSSPVLLVGSAISQFPPTNLVSGFSFTEQLYDYIFFEDIFKNGIYDWLREEFNQLPFEAVMECFPLPNILPIIIKNIFQTEVTNKLHDYLGKNLANGRFSSIITPNYDLCIDSILKKEFFSNVVKTIGDTEHLDYHNPIFFKIHGSAENGFESTLIFTLNQEGRLLDWKVDLLRNLLKNKILIVIGYSGRDFDICPLIAEINNYKKIIWIQFKGSTEITAYQEFLLKSKLSNKLVFGSFHDFVSFWSNEELIFNESDTKPTIQFGQFNLNKSELYQWQLLILNRIACPSIGIERIQNLKNELNENFVLNILYGMYGHRGEYAKAARIKENSALKKSEESRDYILDLIGESRSWLPYGNFIKSYLKLWLAKKLIRKLFPLDNELNTFSKTTEITFLMKINQILNKPVFFLFFPLKLYVKQKAKNLNRQKEIEDLSISGFLDSRKTNHHNLERLGIDSGSNNLSAFKAYKSLGLPGMAIIAYRDKIRYKKWEADEKPFEELGKFILRAEKLGMNTEMWKLCRLYLQNCKLSKREKIEIWRKWKTNLKTTEYSFAYRILAKYQLYLNWFRTL